MKSALAYSPRRFHSTSSSTEAKGTLARRPQYKKVSRSAGFRIRHSGEEHPKAAKGPKNAAILELPWDMVLFSGHVVLTKRIKAKVMAFAPALPRPRQPLNIARRKDGNRLYTRQPGLRQWDSQQPANTTGFRR